MKEKEIWHHAVTNRNGSTFFVDLKDNGNLHIAVIVNGNRQDITIANDSAKGLFEAYNKVFIKQTPVQSSEA